MDMINNLTTYYKNRLSFVFMKCGDGEQACIHGAWGSNCDGHPYSAELGEQLKQAFALLRPVGFVVDFEDQYNYNCLLHRSDSDKEKVSTFWKMVQIDWRRKIYVGPERLKKVSKWLDTDEFVAIPEYNAFADSVRIIEKFKSYPLPTSVFIFSGGISAKY